jgi:benzylsuccinate CoA-transferase BbsF subunit
MGYPEEGAHMSGNAYPDPAAALHATGAILTALFYKQRTGKGQHIDLSQAESATCLIGEAVLGYTLNGKIPIRLGNRHPVYAPQGCYRCKGEDRWVVINVSTEKEWEALCRVMGRLDCLKNERYFDLNKRWKNHDEIDKKIEDWTSRHTPYEAMHILQEAGVPAGAVLDAADLLADEHLRERNFFLEIDHPEVGPRKYCGLPIKSSNVHGPSQRPAPCLGEHNEYILEKFLGLSQEEIVQLKEKDIIGTQPII